MVEAGLVSPSQSEFSHSQIPGLYARGLSVASVTDIDPASRELLARVDSAIKGNKHLSRHRVYCQEESGIVVLHGRVGSFFQKQMAQEALKRLDGVEKIINELEVDWMACIEDRSVAR
jgi:hypothetical protein